MAGLIAQRMAVRNRRSICRVLDWHADQQILETSQMVAGFSRHAKNAQRIV